MFLHGIYCYYHAFFSFALMLSASLALITKLREKSRRSYHLQICHVFIVVVFNREKSTVVGEFIRSAQAWLRWARVWVFHGRIPWGFLSFCSWFVYLSLWLCTTELCIIGKKWYRWPTERPGAEPIIPRPNFAIFEAFSLEPKTYLEEICLIGHAENIANGKKARPKCLC